MAPPPLVRRPHSAERGTTIFIVVLVITLLTGIGLFAARVTGSVDAATGSARQSAQARALAVYAAQLAPVALATERSVIDGSIDTTTSTFTPCATNGYLPGLQCALRQHIDLTRLATRTGAADGVLAAQTAALPGSLGPSTGAATLLGVEGNLSIEYFERGSAPPLPGDPGDSSATAGKKPPMEYAITATAQIRPIIGATSDAWCSSANATANANIQSVRAYVTAP